MYTELLTLSELQAKKVDHVGPINVLVEKMG